MPSSRRELVEQVLENIQKAETGQPISAEDADVIDRLINPAIADLRARTKVLSFLSAVGKPGDLSSGSIPDEALLPLANIVALPAAVKFGMPEGSFAASAADAESRLRAQAAETQVDEPIRFLSY